MPRTPSPTKARGRSCSASSGGSTTSGEHASIRGIKKKKKKRPPQARKKKPGKGPATGEQLSSADTPSTERSDDSAGVATAASFDTAAAADLTVLATRTDLFDSGVTEAANTLCSDFSIDKTVAEYQYQRADNTNTNLSTNGTVATCRCRSRAMPVNPMFVHPMVDNATPNPHEASVNKYWKQRRRLFSRFDEGIRLDEQGWFSVTPEQIAHHVANRTVEMCRHASSTTPFNNTNNSNTLCEDGVNAVGAKITVLDAFCGCGGNSIAFASHPDVAQVICVDLDRSKLQRAANNAAIYKIPPSKLFFLECNALFLLEHCYAGGRYILDEPLTTPEKAMALMAVMPPPVPTETFFGYQIGGIDLLPRSIDAVFMDPPWGGVDYGVFGDHGYCLARNMRIQRPINQMLPAAEQSQDGVTDGFFDSFATEAPSTTNGPRSKQQRKADFNSGLDESNCVNGAELLALAAAATTQAQVVYDVPRNTNRVSLGRAGLLAGYRGNAKLEEYHLNGRLKTVTAYFGIDWRQELLHE